MLKAEIPSANQGKPAALFCQLLFFFSPFSFLVFSWLRLFHKVNCPFHFQNELLSFLLQIPPPPTPLPPTVCTCQHFDLKKKERESKPTAAQASVSWSVKPGPRPCVLGLQRL